MEPLFGSFQNDFGRTLHTVSWNPASSARCVIGIVHGLGEHSQRYAPVAERLVAEGFSVWGYDQQGHGRTGGKLPSFQTLLDDVDAYVRHLKTLHESVFLYGQSLGGGLVVHYALRKTPDLGGVVASSPLLQTTEQPPAWKLMVARTLGKLWPSMTLPTGIDAHQLSHDEAAVRRYLEDPLVHRKISAALGVSMLEAGEWSMAHASQLKTKMLLMHGSEDKITSAKSSQRFAQDAGGACAFRLWEGLFHDLHFETEKDKVLQCVCDWIRTCLEENRG